MSKDKFTAEQIEAVRKHMKSVLSMQSSDRELFIAQTIGDVYDEELPIANPIAAISKIARAGNRPEDNHVYYLTPDSIDKKVYTLDSNCNVTQVQVTPNTRTELALNEIVSPDFWVCLKDFLAGDHDALKVYADSASEALDRKEVKNVLALLDAGAIAESNIFSLDSGKEALDYPKVVEMARSIAKYGKNLVFIMGANVFTDTLLMDFNADTFRKYGLESLNITPIVIEESTVDTDASGQEAVLDADVAYLVAVSDSKNNKPVLVARRKLSLAADMADTTEVGQDRIIIDTGNMKNVGSAVKYARGKAAYEHFGAVLLNSKVVAKFTRA